MSASARSFAASATYAAIVSGHRSLMVSPHVKVSVGIPADRKVNVLRPSCRVDEGERRR